MLTKGPVTPINFTILSFISMDSYFRTKRPTLKVSTGESAITAKNIINFFLLNRYWALHTDVTGCKMNWTMIIMFLHVLYIQIKIKAWKTKKKRYVDRKYMLHPLQCNSYTYSVKLKGIHFHNLLKAWLKEVVYGCL